jgi:cation-transporting ATPase 13A2
MCFDKTGTLTEEGLDMYGIRPIMYISNKKIKFSKIIKEPNLLNNDLEEIG